MSESKAFRVRADEVRKGDVLVCDGGFTCIERGAERVVEQRDEGEFAGDLYIACMHGRHYLDGQIDAEGTHYIGLRKRETAEPVG